MVVQFYKPNPKNTGCAVSFDLGVNNKAKSQDYCVFAKAIKQFSWDDERKTGSFSGNAKDPEKSLILKLNENELGGLIWAIEHYEEFSAFHKFQENTTQIFFKPYTKKNGTKAFSFSIIRNTTNKFVAGIELGEAASLAIFLKLALEEIYTARIERNFKYFKSKDGTDEGQQRQQQQEEEEEDFDPFE